MADKPANRKRKTQMINIKLTEAQATELVAHLEGLSDTLAHQHEQEHSGVAKFMLLSIIQGVDRLAVDINEQVEAQTEKPASMYQALTEA